MNALNNQLAAMKDRKPKPAPAEKTATKSPAPHSRAPRSPKPSVEKDGKSWEDSHRRATFHLPNSLLDDLDAFCTATGRSKSEVVRTALTDEIG